MLVKHLKMEQNLVNRVRLTTEDGQEVEFHIRRIYDRNKVALAENGARAGSARGGGGVAVSIDAPREMKISFEEIGEDQIVRNRKR